MEFGIGTSVRPGDARLFAACAPKSGDIWPNGFNVWSEC